MCSTCIGTMRNVRHPTTYLVFVRGANDNDFREEISRSETDNINNELNSANDLSSIHQHFTYNFYACRSQKSKKIQLSHQYLFTLSGSASVKAVRRTLMKSPTRCQFHQHFTRSFFVWKCFAQLFSCYNLALKFFVKRLLVRKSCIINLLIFEIIFNGINCFVKTT